jgi:hypothetical protein
MSVRSVLCLLVVLTCYRNISAQGGELRWIGLHYVAGYREPTGQ